MKKNIKIISLVISLLAFHLSFPSFAMQDGLEAEGHVSTLNGKLFYRDTGGKGPVLALFHGNSASSQIFEKLMKAGLPYRMIAFDSPGHGKSDDFLNCKESYCHLGCARAFREGLDKLKIGKFSALGWSEGGHQAINLLYLVGDRMESLIFTGTPPLPHDPELIFTLAFKDIPEMKLLGKEEKFNKEEALRFVECQGLDPNDVPFMIEAAMRTDGLARTLPLKIIMEGGERINEVETIKRSKTPILILGGKNDIGVNYVYVQDLMKSFPENVKMHLLDGPHAHLWTNSEEFNSRVDRFLKGNSKLLKGHSKL
ncbi:MAG: alpha/beta hydrolase [Alphaproteobacteria bacterium]|nr:alpha/beta hydrolase [Alphaproteobacteria bacterium]